MPTAQVPVKLFQLFQCEVGRIFLLDFLFEAKIMSLYEFLHGHVMSFCSSKCTKDRSIVLKTLDSSVPAPLLTSHEEHWRFFGSWKLRQHRCAEHISTATEGLSIVVVTVVFANCSEEAIKVPKLSWMSKAGSSKLEC